MLQSKQTKIVSSATVVVPVQTALPAGSEIGFAAAPVLPEKSRETRTAECLNCGKSPLYTKFCPDCGQENLRYPLPIGVLLRDVLEEFWRWDGKLLRTLGLLLFRPGKLTNEYNAGRRTRFISPFKLYLGMTTLFFFLLFLPSSWNTFQHRWQSNIPLTKEQAQRQERQPKKTTQKQETATEKEALITAKSEGVTLGLTASEKRGLEWRPQMNSAALEKLSLFDNQKMFAPNALRGRPLRQGHLLEEYDFWQEHKANTKKDSGIRRVISEQFLKLLDAPERFMQEMGDATIKVMFVLMPVYAFFLTVLFRRSQKYYVEHLVFAANHHTFVFTLAFVLFVGRDFGGKLIVPVLLLYYVHEFLALRTVYKDSIGKTLLKQFLLNQFYGFVLIIGLTVTALVTFALL